MKAVIKTLMPSEQKVTVFVISCIKFKKRRTFMKKQLAKHGIDFEFIDSVDKDTLSDKELQKWNPQGNLSSGEIACTIGHRMAYQKMIDENLPYALILEDDVILSKKAKKLLQEPELSIRGFCFLKCGTIGDSRYQKNDLVSRNLHSHRILSKGFHCYQLSHGPHGAYSYLISQDTAAKRLRETEVQGEPLDDYSNSKEEYCFEAVTSPVLSWLSLHNHASEIREVKHTAKFNQFEWLKRHDFYFRLRRFLKGVDRKNRKTIKQKVASGELSQDGKWDILPWGSSDILHQADPSSRP